MKRIYIGINDKNDRGIFLGDIILWYGAGGAFRKVFEVKSRDNKIGHNVNPRFIDEMQVVGNVFDILKKEIK